MELIILPVPAGDDSAGPETTGQDTIPQVVHNLVAYFRRSGWAPGQVGYDCTGSRQDAPYRLADQVRQRLSEAVSDQGRAVESVDWVRGRDTSVDGLAERAQRRRAGSVAGARRFEVLAVADREEAVALAAKLGFEIDAGAFDDTGYYGTLWTAAA